jgi:hypothetical protein
MPQDLIICAGHGFTVLSPTTGQATIWLATRDEASRWARDLTTHGHPATAHSDNPALSAGTEQEPCPRRLGEENDNRTQLTR